jgi:predicted dehydrogenase
MPEVRLMTFDPGHFHAALVQKEMYPGVARQTHIYAPLGPDLLAHHGRMVGFNTRKEHPTAWELEIHAGPDSLARMLRERPGNVVVLSGRNRGKIDAILAAVHAGLNVLADKPWVIAAADLPKLQTALDLADERGLIAYDIMTERHEITSILQRELIQDADTFGTIQAGTEQEPGVLMESMHYLMKTVAGAPLRRPPWFFDVHQQGEGLTDVGTHLVDLMPWLLFPEQPMDYRRDVKVLTAERWPTTLSRTQFQYVTGEPDFPDYLAADVHQGRLDYFCNTLVSYTLRGIHAKFNILWNLEAAGGAGDTHFASIRGSRARIEVRQSEAQKYRPELYVVPNDSADKGVYAAAGAKVAALQARFPGVAVEEMASEAQILIPDRYRTGHEAHFAQVTGRFLNFLDQPQSLPAWEKPNMLYKYYVTTRGVELSRQAAR